MARPHRAERVEGVTSCNICSARGRLRGLRGAENPVSAVWKLALGLTFLLKTKDLLGSYGFLGPDSSRGACRHVGGCARVVTFRSGVPRRPRQPPGTLDGPWGPVTGMKIGKVRWIKVVKDRAGVVSVPQPRQIDSRGNTPPAVRQCAIRPKAEALAAPCENSTAATEIRLCDWILAFVFKGIVVVPSCVMAHGRLPRRGMKKGAIAAGACAAAAGLSAWPCGPPRMTKRRTSLSGRVVGGPRRFRSRRRARFASA